MPLPLLRGSRLLLRPAGRGDLDFFADLNSDVGVMAHITGGRAGRSETEDEWAQRLGPRSDIGRGLGYWVGLVDADPIGWRGLGHVESDLSSGELGFRIRSTQWRNGLGSEGARLLLGHAFRGCGLARVWAGTTRASTASRRTLESVGLEPTDEPFPGVSTYELTRTEWHNGVAQPT